MQPDPGDIPEGVEMIRLDFNDLALVESQAGKAAEVLAEASEEDKQTVRRLVAANTSDLSDEFKLLDMLGLM